MTTIPTLKWAQRSEKVFVTWDAVDAKDVKVTLSDGLLSIDGELKGTTYKLENLPLFLEIDVEESKWFKNDRAVIISLKKKGGEYWDGLTTDKTYKKYIKVDFSKFCEEDDPEYTGEISMAGMDGMGGMGGMGGMDMSQLMGQMGGMGGMGGMGDFDDDDDEADLDDLNADAPPPLDDGDGPPPLESDGAKLNPEDMEEVD